MKAYSILQLLEEIAPLSLQESYDNSGIMCGDPAMEVHSALLSLDCTEDVVDEAIQKGINMLICHHPLIFSGIKSISGKNEVERCIMKAIKNDLFIYAIHTNLDHVFKGVNQKLSEVLGLQNLKILRPLNNQLCKLSFFVPQKEAEEVRAAVFEAGAGEIGNYSHCSFNVEGEGSFQANEGSDPFVGEVGKLHFEKEIRVEVILPNYLLKSVLKALKKKHPYEEVAYDVYPVTNEWEKVGSGMIGELEEAIPAEDFLKLVKARLNAGCIRHTKLCKKEIKKVAVCGGSGSFLLKDAIAKEADIFITADYKYHQFFEADEKIIIADVGHFESEQYTAELIQSYLQEKFPNFATYLSESRTNPIYYL